MLVLVRTLQTEAKPKTKNRGKVKLIGDICKCPDYRGVLIRAPIEDMHVTSLVGNFFFAYYHFCCICAAILRGNE